MPANEEKVSLIKSIQIRGKSESSSRAGSGGPDPKHANILQRCNRSIQKARTLARKSLGAQKANRGLVRASGVPVAVALAQHAGGVRTGSEIFGMEGAAVELSIKPAQDTDFRGAKRFKPTID